ncbi:MAG: hypothetical protein JSW26_00010 [Desulfobacterales bacterium]|nr:MAG: hypothetical protein JSW26_00010 [Desulfobacterales bacterium]
MSNDEQPYLETSEAEVRGEVSNAQKRINLFLLQRHPELPPPDVRGVEPAPEEMDETALDEAARRVADGEEAPANFLIAARACEKVAAAARWNTIVQEAVTISDVREIDPESGDHVT